MLLDSNIIIYSAQPPTCRASRSDHGQKSDGFSDKLSKFLAIIVLLPALHWPPRA